MILYITRKFPPSIGGMQRFNEKLVKHLSQLEEIQLIKWGGSQIFLPFFIIYTFFRALLIIWTKNIHCIYVSDGVLSPLGLILKWCTKKPTISNIHGSDIAFNSRLYQSVIPKCLTKLDKVICVSETLKEECKKRGILIENISVIPNGVDIDDFSHEKSVQNMQILENSLMTKLNGKKILLSVGRLIPNKGFNHFIKNILPLVLIKHSDIIYLIVGEGPERKTIETTINDMNYQHHVKLLGELPMDSETLTRLYCQSDIFIMPNIPYPGKKEGFGIVSIEAGAAGLPVVASNVDGIVQAIKNGENGFLIRHDDFQGFADKVLELIKNDEYRISFGQKTREFVKQHYDWAIIAKQYQQEFSVL